jgi:hypothetical protein
MKNNFTVYLRHDSWDRKKKSKKIEIRAASKNAAAFLILNNLKKHGFSFGSFENLGYFVTMVK